MSKHVVELIREKSEYLELAWADQRQQVSAQWETVFLGGLNKVKRLEVIVRSTRNTPDLIIARGAEVLQDAEAAFGTLGGRWILDASSSFDFENTDLRSLKNIQRAICYSTKTENLIRRKGLGRVSTLGGPYLGSEYAEVPNRVDPSRITVGLIPTGVKSEEVIRQVLKRLGDRNGSIEWIGPVKHPLVEWEPELVAIAIRSNLLVSPFEDIDFGGPHESLALAVSTGRPIMTARTSSSEFIQYPKDGVYFLEKYSLGAGSYVRAIEDFFRTTTTRTEWADRWKIERKDITMILNKALES